MTLNRQLIVGDSRISAIAKNLAQVFATRKSNFSKVQHVAHQQLREIYMKYFDVTNSIRWQNFNFTFTNEQISKALMSIKPQKDPGPMGLSAKMLQFSEETVYST